MRASLEYEDEYRAHSSEAAAHLETARATADRDDRQQAAAAASRSIDAAREVVSMLEMEAGALPKTERAPLSSRIRAYRSELTDLSRRLREATRADARQAAAVASDCIREELFSAASGDGGGRDESERMLANSDRLASSTNRLREAHAATLDMEERGAAIMGDLARQRETLMRTRGTLGAAREGLEASRRVLRQMGRRAATNKAVLRGIFAVVLLMFLWIAWPSAEAPSPPVG
ncbi:vesicle transport through interaction with t-snares [Emiliania huxleyi CCMP1516]|uniref:Vesicle transport v-SNARE N-terminal domain-containing protein n=2 Tax=Emiliania huxleyi TaxID=2903 RepID=A0A0D3J4P1_EMIH1|nr:vesicle transport through interaction with t-snares [Emiliania huxleyi CCMP1516]EOD18476.1 vesicle transport through interaction with t-snares [Emiliania huxleyi CCMP1516]|eukprot:XP_005770905.1 vesicle transport through interaction with t-snares [Emiliania huxleyi CCMP1516]